MCLCVCVSGKRSNTEHTQAQDAQVKCKANPNNSYTLQQQHNQSNNAMLLLFLVTAAAWNVNFVECPSPSPTRRRKAVKAAQLVRDTVELKASSTSSASSSTTNFTTTITNDASVSVTANGYPSKWLENVQHQRKRQALSTRRQMIDRIMHYKLWPLRRWARRMELSIAERRECNILNNKMCHMWLGRDSHSTTWSYFHTHGFR